LIFEMDCLVFVRIMNDLDTLPSLSGAAVTYVHTLFGGMPPPCTPLKTTLVHELNQTKRRMRVYRVGTQAPHSLAWHLTLYLPLSRPRDGCPLLLSPDGCWTHVITPDAIDAVLGQGIALAFFDRLNLAHDRPDGMRSGAIYSIWPDAPWGAVSAWAWGLRQTLRALQKMVEINALHISVIGHSRGGKAALLAGATDPAIALTVTHNSGCAGAASFQVKGPGAETLPELHAAFPHWLGAACHDRTAWERIEALDNTALLQSLHGRHLCVMQADDDLWANPQGTHHAVTRLRKDWTDQGCGGHLTHLTRNGGHAMSADDWGRAAHILAAISQP